MVNKEKQMLLCRKCTNCRINLEDGIVCSLTNKKANFTDTCSRFQKKIKHR